jgi:hypothetical protein
MADILCGYTADREETLVAYVYDDIDAVTRAGFEAHLSTCERCRTEIADLRGARDALQRWGAPESIGGMAGRVAPQPLRRASLFSKLREIPVWAQASAALLCLGVAAGFANLQVHYDGRSVSIGTGWMRALEQARPPQREAVPASVAAAGTSPAWRADLERVERELRQELQGSTQGPARAGADADAELLKRVRGLIDESERRQQRELALRVGEVMRDVTAQRNADLVQIDRSLGAIQNNTGVEVLRTREMLNYLMSVSQKR